MSFDSSQGPTRIDNKTAAIFKDESIMNSKKLLVVGTEFEAREKHDGQRLWWKMDSYMQVQIGYVILCLNHQFYKERFIYTNPHNVGQKVIGSSSALANQSMFARSNKKKDHPNFASLTSGKKAQNHPILESIKSPSVLRIFSTL